MSATNNICLIGYLTRDIEMRYAQSTGKAIAISAIALNKRIKNKSGEYENKPVFIDITLFDKTAENISQFAKKGSRLAIQGELDFDTWTDKRGEKCQKHSIIVTSAQILDKKEQTQNTKPNTDQYEQNVQEDFNEEIPF